MITLSLSKGDSGAKRALQPAQSEALTMIGIVMDAPLTSANQISG
jgi:hypothetical protein